MPLKQRTVFFFCLVLLALLELLARAFFASPWSQVRDRGISPFGAGDLPPAKEYIENILPDMPFYVKTSSLGTRNSREVAWEKIPGVFRIAALGDSFTYGAHVNNHETWPSQLERLLQGGAENKIEVVNLGVSGYTIEDEYTLLRDKAVRLHPDLILLAFYSNDIPDFAAPQREVFKRRLSGRSPAKLAYAIREFSKHSAFLSTLIYFKHRVRAIQVFKKIKDAEADYSPTERAAFRQQYLHYLRRIVAFAREHHQPLAWVFFPACTELAKDDANNLQSKTMIKKELEKAGVKYLDLLPALRRAGDAEALYLMPKEWHMGRYGYLVAARELAGFVQREFPEACPSAASGFSGPEKENRGLTPAGSHPSRP
jgi:lysophospholipase L1-like esterase